MPSPSIQTIPAARVLVTGDLVRLRDDGLIDLVGRKDRQIKIRGQRIEPAGLEAALRAEPGVREAAVYPRAVGRTHWLIAYVESDASVIPALKETLRAKLPPALQPQRIHVLSAIPRLASGKLDMTALAALDAEYQLREVTRDAAAGTLPQGDTEEAIAAIWRRLFGRADIARDADFFDLGGDSLMTLDLMFAIEERFAQSFPRHRHL